jgi:ribose transport system permease protein
MKKLIGLFVFLLILYGLLLVSDEGARSAYNHYNLGKRIGLYGILSLGAGVLIIAGGIDLSIGAVVGLCTTTLAILLTELQWHPVRAIGTTLALGAGIGLVNGLMVAKLRLQPFVITLCGLFIYRGLAQWIAGNQNKGLGSQFPALREALATTQLFGGVPVALVILLALAAVAAVFLHGSIYGRYLFAIGGNDLAARYSGVAVDRYRILAYVVCSLSAALFSVLFLMEENAVQPSNTGSFFELYAIAGAVLGGCSLRGGEGNVAGILIGTTILWILPNFTNMWGVPSELKFTVIGAALLVGALLDELLRRRGTRGKA